MIVNRLLPADLFAGKCVFVTEQLSPNGFESVMDIDVLGSFPAAPLVTYATRTVPVVDGGSDLAGSAAFGEAIETLMGPRG